MDRGASVDAPGKSVKFGTPLTKVRYLPSMQHRKYGWTPRLETASSSKHQGIFDALVADIANGRLGPGDRLPSQRLVARVLGVDLTTVTKAYNLSLIHI